MGEATAPELSETAPLIVFAVRGRNSAWRYVAAFVLALLIAIVLGVVLAIVLTLAGRLPANLGSVLLDPAHPAAFFLGNGVVFALLLLGICLGPRLVQGKRPMDLIGAWSWRLMIAGAGIWIAVLVLGTAADFALAPSAFSWTASPQLAGLAAVAAIGLGVQTFAEEVVFRGFVTQGLLLATRRPVVAALLSACLFGAIHLPNGAPQAVSATVVGFGLALIAIRLGGLAFGFGLHLANNLFGSVVVVASNDVFRGAPGLLLERAPQLAWWDVGVAAVAMLALAWAVRGPWGERLRSLA